MTKLWCFVVEAPRLKAFVDFVSGTDASGAAVTIRGEESDPVVPGEECATESIHVPGAIQPHGYLVSFDAATSVVQHVSANLCDLVGMRVDELLGHSLSECLPSIAELELSNIVRVSSEIVSDRDFMLELAGKPFVGTAHRLGTLVVFEVEPYLPAAFDVQPLFARTLRRLQQAAGRNELQEVAVREVRELTGCDRVVVYAFGAGGHGQVVAEAKSPDVASYLGLNFPASDIPTQARELYKLNWLRMIPDVDYAAVHIVGLQAPASHSPLDLTFSTLRSVSPVHREYMRHMGARSSLSISLICDGELWGLLSCVHSSPRLLSRQIRSACLSLGRLLSLQIAALEGVESANASAFNVTLLAPIISHMRGSNLSVLGAISELPEQMLRLTGSTGVAVLAGKQLRTFGECPAESQVMRLAEWSASKARESGHYSTATLPLDYPEANSYATIASGLLVILLPKPILNMVLWFRPEVAQTINWAGDPNKNFASGNAGSAVRLGPRHSFEAWVTLLRRTSKTWEPHRVQAAVELRRFAIEFDLTAQVALERLAVTSRDELVAIVSHDLRSPLMVVKLQAAMLVRNLIAESSASSRRMLAASQSILRATDRMGQMLRDLLDASTLEEGRYRVELGSYQVEQIFEDAQALLMPIADAKKIELVFSTESNLMVRADPERIFQLLSNLVGNAVKFSAEGTSVRVSAHADPLMANMVRFEVADRGVGIAAEKIDHIFERRWYDPSGNGTGFGLGLYIAYGIVSSHDGELAVTSEVGVGSVFSFALAVPTD